MGCRVNRSDEILFLTATIMKDFSSHPRAALITRWSELSFDRFLWLFRNMLRTLAPRRIVAETRAELTLAVGVIMNNCFARELQLQADDDKAHMYWPQAERSTTDDVEDWVPSPGRIV